MSNASGKRLAVLWEIERTDGVVLRFTDHDAPVDLNFQTYSPAFGHDSSARRFQDGLKESSTEFRGVISSSAITEDDLRAGRYRDAKITEAVVDWRYPYQGTLLIRFFWVDQTVWTGEGWSAELSGPERFLRRSMGTLFTRNCANTLGDALCQVSLAGYTVTGVTAAGTDDGSKKLSMVATGASLGAFSNGYFAYGTIEATSGANDGIRRVIKTFRGSDRRFAFQTPFPFDIAAGDTFTIVAGCDRTSSTCRTKFSNLVNFGGFLFMPGPDRVLQTPRRA